MFGATAASLLSKALGMVLRGSIDSIESLRVRTWQHFLEVVKAVLGTGSSCKNGSDSGVGAEEDLAWQQEQTTYRSNVLSLMSPHMFLVVIIVSCSPKRILTEALLWGQKTLKSVNNVVRDARAGGGTFLGTIPLTAFMLSKTCQLYFKV